MAYSRGFGLNGKSVYANITKPEAVFVNFTVNSADTKGMGVTSVKSNGYLEYVFMFTSQTPGKAGNGVTNPNPQAGYALICFRNNFNTYLYSNGMVSGPATSTSTTSVTAGNVYTITALGTATLAQWQAKGLPMGFVPTVGQAFVATASGTIGGSAHVGLPGLSATYGISIVGDPNQTVSNSSIAPNAGAQIIVQFTATGTQTFTGSALATHTHALTLKNAAVVDGATTRVNAGTNLLGANTGSDITVAGGGANGGIGSTSAGTPAGTISAGALAATAPTDSSIVQMLFWYDGSSVTIDGL